MSEALVIRAMEPTDAAAVARLAGQLGYTATAAELAQRIPQVVGHGRAAALVAEEGGSLVGWAHVELKATLVEVPSAQLMALVVDEDARNKRVGLALLRAAEQWALARGVRRMLVGSRVTRERAHRFYLREGYEIAKTSYFFEKRLDRTARREPQEDRSILAGEPIQERP